MQNNSKYSTSVERARLRVHRSIIETYKRYRRESPDVSNRRLYIRIAAETVNIFRKQNFTPDAIRKIVVSSGAQIPAMKNRQ